MKCDVRKEEDILSMFDNIKTQFGGADVCINNAGLMRPSPLLSGSTEEWREQLEVSKLFSYHILLVIPFRLMYLVLV